MTWQAVLIVLASLVGFGAVLKGWGWWLRTRALRALPQPVRMSRGISLRVLVHGTEALPGMGSRRANRTTGDLALGAERFLVTSNRGVLADVGPSHGRKFTSVRSPGPGKLVIEGDVPRSDGQKGLFRIEAFLPDAAEWVDALQAYVEASPDGPRFATKAPWPTSAD
jgi:hypothetical protein